MVRTYSISYKSKSKMPSTKEAMAELEEKILNETEAESVKLSDEGKLISIEADSEQFSSILNKVVNIFRQIDDKSEVSYQFGLNK